VLGRAEEGLARAAAGRDSEALYSLGFALEARRELAAASRVYATLVRARADNWAEAVVGLVSFARVAAKLLLANVLRE
jgi:hypothetical protein